MDIDMKNKCYICNIERYQFDRNADGFVKHIEKDHCLWNYLYFIFHLKHQDSTEYNGIESYVHQKIENDDQTWFPLNRSISLANSTQSNEQITEFMKNKTNTVLQQLEELNNKILTLQK